MKPNSWFWSSFLFLFLPVLSESRAATINWVGPPGSGNWSLASNWNANRVPAADDDVVIAGPVIGTDTYTVTLDAHATINNLTVGSSVSGVQTLHLNSAAFTLTLNGTATVGPTGVLRINSGTLSGGTVNVNGTLRWNSGTMRNGTTNINPGGTLTMDLDGAPARQLDAYTLNNQSSAAAFDSTTSLFFANGGTFNNLAGAILELRNNSLFSGGTGGTFSNAGTVRRLGSTGIFAIDGPVRFDNSGTVQVETGMLELRGGGTQSGTFAISTGATLSFHSGTYNLNGGTSFAGAGLMRLHTGSPALILQNGITINAQNVTLGGGRMEGGAVNVAGNLIFVGATLRNGLTTVGASGTLSFPSGGSKILDGHTLSNFGTANVDATDNSNLFFQNNAVFRNEAGALLELRSDRFFTNNMGTGGRVDNFGTVRRLGTGLFTIDSLVAFNNSGIVEVQTGTLQLGGGGSIAGSIELALNTTLNLRSGPFTLTTTAVTGEGFLRINGGIVTIPQIIGPGKLGSQMELALPIQGVLMDSGELTGAGNVSIAFCIFKGGTLSGSGDIVIEPGATFNIGDPVGEGQMTIRERTIENSGTLRFLSVGRDVSLTTGALINNAGLFEVNSERDFIGDGTARIISSGVVRKTGGTVTALPTRFDGLSFMNTGTLEVSAGRFTVPNFTQTSGKLQLRNVAQIEGTLQIQGGSFGGVGTIIGNVTSSGQMGIDGVTDALTINGIYTQTSVGSFSAEIAGNASNQIDRVQFSQAPNLNGTLAASLENGFRPATGEELRLLTFPSRMGDFSAFQGLMLGGNDRLIPYRFPTRYSLIANTQLADLQITQTATPDRVNGGQNVTYQLTVVNAGPLDATDVILVDSFPAGATLASVPSGCSATSTSLTCSLGDLPVGQDVDVMVTVTAPTTGGTMTNTATVACDQTDPQPGDNYSACHAAVIGSPSDVVITSIAPEPLMNGGESAFNVHGQNFQQGAMVSIDCGDPFETDETVCTATTLSSTNIQVECDLVSDQFMGDCECEVENPDGGNASRPVQILPELNATAFEATGTLGFAVGRYTTNRVLITNIGGDAVVLATIQPPEPGKIDFIVGNPSVWDSKTEEDKTSAPIMMTMGKGETVSVALRSKADPEHVNFTDQPVPGKIDYNDTREVVFEGVAVPTERFARVVTDFMLSADLCEELRVLLRPRMRAELEEVIYELLLEGQQLALPRRPEDFLFTLLFKLRERGLISISDEEWQRLNELCAENFAEGIKRAAALAAKSAIDQARVEIGTSDEGRAVDLAADALEILTRTRATKLAILHLEGLLQQERCKPFLERASSWQPIRAPFDPNDKTSNSFWSCEVAPSGSATPCLRYFSSLTDPIEFVLQFENKKEANAEAVDVTITDTLDSNLDISTLTVLGSSHPGVLTTQVAGQQATFRFTNINLPPNVTPPQGEGFVRFTVRPVVGIASGTEIRNRASIVFDFNPPILTPEVTYVFSSDGDQDGVLDVAEDRAPNGGDGNGDATADRQQAWVTSTPLSPASSYATLISAGGCNQNHNVTPSSEAAHPDEDLDYRYPSTLLSFSLPCSSADLTIIYHGTASLSGSTFRHYSSAMPGEPSTRLWFPRPGAAFGTTSVGGAAAGTVTYSLTDGAQGDDTAADGRIVSLGGAASPASQLKFSRNQFFTSEYRGNALVSVERQGNPSGIASINYQALDASAMSGGDYVASSGTLTWADGDSAVKMIQVPIVNDSTTEGTESLRLLLTNPAGTAEPSTPSEALLVILELIGDANGDGTLTVADIFFLINHVFLSGEEPIAHSDANADNALTAADVIYLLNHMFANGPRPL